MALICHTYPGITPLNIWEIELPILNGLIDAAIKMNTPAED